MDPNVPRILNFWFSPFNSNDYTKWFTPSPTFDAEIRSQFSPLIHQARASPSPLNDTWGPSGTTTDPHSPLALILLLDQFPRNVYRGTPDSFAADPKALDVAVKSIAAGHDRQVPLIRQTFFYLPLMHSEDLLAQIAGVAAYEGLVQRCREEGDEGARAFAESGLDSSRGHRDVIRRFGRFPSRNRILGREETVEEREFLEEHPDGF